MPHPRLQQSSGCLKFQRPLKTHRASCEAAGAGSPPHPARFPSGLCSSSHTRAEPLVPSARRISLHPQDHFPAASVHHLFGGVAWSSASVGLRAQAENLSHSRPQLCDGVEGQAGAWQISLSRVWWLMLIIPVHRESEAGGVL